MKPLLYISDSDQHVAELRRILNAFCAVEYRHPSEADNIPHFCAVVFNWHPDRAATNKTLTNLAVECCRSGVPVILCTTRRGQLPSEIKSSVMPAAIVDLPFNRRQMIDLIGDLQRKQHELSGNNIHDMFITTTTEVFRTTGGMEVSPGATSHAGSFSFFGDVHGSLELTGALEGAAAISLPRDFATELAGRIIGEESSELSDADIEEVAAEIINQIAGAVRTRLWHEERPFNISVPCITSHPDDSAYCEPNKMWYATVLKFENYTFMLQTSITCLARSPIAVNCAENVVK